MAAPTAQGSVRAPDRRPLTKLQSKRLAALTELNADELAGGTVADLQVKYPWRIDPQLFLFRRICGRVVRKDPVSGVELPVAFATVHVEDTDCHFLGYFPKPHPWAWYFPYLCHREEIGSAKTDACGNFCVWIPRFDIDWILRWRRERHCFPYIFARPSLFEVLKHLVDARVPPFPRPLPDPPELEAVLQQLGPEALNRAADLVGSPTATRLDLLRANATFGRDTRARDRLLSAPAFPRHLAPPLPPEFKTDAVGTAEKGGRDSAVQATLAAILHIEEPALRDLRLDRYIGPFWRCYDVFVPEWIALFDVPDITFRVTQDVNGDGTEENVYSEGYFDVRWDDVTTTDVTLYASSAALVSTACNPPVVVCGNVPALLYSGLMPLSNTPTGDPYLDNTMGYAQRPNRPHPTGDFVDPTPHPLATAPFCQTLQLYGCTRIPNAAFYRVRRREGSGSMMPFVGLTWPLNRAVGGPPSQIWPASDASGWYPILNPAENWFPQDLLLEWPTGGVDGLFTLDVQVADAARNVLATSTPVRLRIDNTSPVGQFTGLRWRIAGGAWHTLPLICPVIGRGSVPNDIEVEVDYAVLAQHLRSTQLVSYGCGGGSMSLLSPLSTIQHWHTGPADNSVAQTARFSLSQAAAAGSYGFSIYAYSRAFNPSGGDGGHLADWNYDPVYLWAVPQINVAIVNA